MAIDQPTELILAFATPAQWESWLEQHHTNQGGLSLKIAKKASGIPTVTYAEAVDIALCYGWIDGIKRPFDELYFLQRFTPRRARSLWSKRNIDKVAALEAAGRMRPAGRAEIERAQQDGRWAAAYDSPANMVVPEDFIQAVAAKPSAQATYQMLNKSNLYAIAFRLNTAKRPETRQRRLEQIIATLERGERLV
jgi:uncharacterized protein YdeI (YjbR/CyaY-like superfamily)